MVKKIIYWIFIVLATGFIVGGAVYIGIVLSSKEDNRKTSDNGSPLKEKEETKDLIIEYKEEVYQAKDTDGNIIVENRRNLPSIKSTKYQEQADKIVNYLKEHSDLRWQEMKSSADDYVKLNMNEKVGVDYVLGNLAQNDSYATFVFKMSGSMGGVSWDDLEAFTFDIKTGDLLSLKDVSSDNVGLRQYVYKELVNYITEQEYVSDLDEGWQLRMQDKISETGNWYLTDEGLNFAFPKYSFGPGSIGIVEYKFEYKDINDFLKENYKKK